MKIMSVEDDLIFKGLIEGVLTEEGHEVTVLSSMEEYTVEAIRDNNPDLILMDIILHEKKDQKREMAHGGIELGLKAFHMKKENKFRDIPILFVTIYGKNKSEKIKDVPNALPPYYLTKPIDFDELLFIINGLKGE